MKDEQHAFLIGAEKAGTTALHSLLARHPEIHGGRRKEPHHYSWTLDRVQLDGGDPDRAMEAYRKNYRGAGPHQIVLDGSTSYLFHPRAAKRIKEAHPDARIVVILRDPALRAWSHYRMHVRNGYTRAPMTQILDEYGPRHEYIQHGLYGEQLIQWRRFFHADQICVVYDQDLKWNQTKTLARVYRHLDVNPVIADSQAPLRANQDQVYRGPLARWILQSPWIGPRLQWIPKNVRDRIRRLCTRKPPRLDAETRERLDQFFAREVVLFHALELRPYWLRRDDR